MFYDSLIKQYYYFYMFYVKKKLWYKKMIMKKKTSLYGVPIFPCLQGKCGISTFSCLKRREWHAHLSLPQKRIQHAHLSMSQEGPCDMLTFLCHKITCAQYNRYIYLYLCIHIHQETILFYKEKMLLLKYSLCFYVVFYNEMCTMTFCKLCAKRKI